MAIHITKKPKETRWFSKAILFLCLVFILSSCSQPKSQNPNSVRLGYLLNITHAVPLVGLESKTFTGIDPYHFTAGGFLLSSLISKNLDIAYIGPGPFINALAKKIDLEILSVSCYGANSLVLSKKYESDPKYFVIRKIAVPQFGNTQDLLARMLVDGIKAGKIPTEKLGNLKFGDDIEFIAVNPAELETAFFVGNIDAALVSEPWGTVLGDKGFTTYNQILDKVNSYPTTLLVVRKEFHDKHPELVEKFLKEEAQVQNMLKTNPEQSIQLIKAHLERVTKKKFTTEVLTTSFSKVDFKNTIEKDKLNELAQAAFEAKYFRHKFTL